MEHLNSDLARISYKKPDEKGILKPGRIEIDRYVSVTDKLAEINFVHEIAVKLSNPKLLGLNPVQARILGVDPEAA